MNDAADPDSLTIHEAIGDLPALLQTLVDENMLFSAYALFGGDVDGLELWGDSRRSSAPTCGEATARPRSGAPRPMRRSGRAKNRDQPSIEPTRMMRRRWSSVHCSPRS
jgi:hypothetical protein